MRKNHALPIAIIGIMVSLLLLQAEGTSLPARLLNPQASDARSTERGLSSEETSIQHDLRSSHHPRDYVLSQSSPPLLLAAVADGELVTYIAFDGTVYQLRQYTGAHTAILIKPEDLDRYTLPRLQELLDRCDLWYAYYKEITQSDPDGEGVDPIAFVKPFGEALGRGRLGAKGVEIDPVALHSESGPQAVVIHELGHNFDKYSTVSMVGPDPPHAWTAFCEPYIAFYSRGAVDPVGAFDQRMSLILNVYLSNPSAAWEACIRDSLCGPLLNSNSLQSSAALRAVQLFGPAVVPRWLERVREASRSLNPSRMSPLDKSDVFADALSRAVNADLSCFFDYLRWPVSDSLRSGLQRRFESSAVCIDRDNDGYSLLAGDCDDANPAINPGADEVANGIDDDCNRVVDDLLFGEAGGDFPNTTASALRLSIPCKVEGAISSAADFDQFQIDFPTESTILFSPRAIGGLSGWIYYYQQGSGQVKDFSYFPEGSFSDVTLTVPAGSWNVAIAVASPPNFGHYPTALGSYEIKIQPQVAAQNPELGVSPPARTVHFNDYILTAPPVPQAFSGRPDVMARFWVYKVGWVGAVPASGSKEASFEWLAPQGMDTGSLWYRVQYYQNSLPLTGISLPAPITVEHDPVSGPVINSATFDGRKTMTISGVRFGDSPQVIINYVDRSTAIKKLSDTSISLKGKAKKLGLKLEDNSVQIYTSSGFASNVLTVRL